jgi:hypothetical protein
MEFIVGLSKAGDNFFYHGGFLLSFQIFSFLCLTTPI